jgi:hypothetical protein
MNAARGASTLLCAACALLASGCAAVDFREPDIDALHASPPDFPMVDSLVKAGFRACETMLSDAVLHATAGQPGTGYTRHAGAETDHRPVMLTVASDQGRDSQHIEVVAGLDASGKCFAQWTLSRVWRTTCEQVRLRSDWFDGKQESASSGRTRLYGVEGQGIAVFLTDIGHRRCFMSAGEVAYSSGVGLEYGPEDPP